jgi:hypothetical protein
VTFPLFPSEPYFPPDPYRPGCVALATGPALTLTNEGLNHTTGLNRLVQARLRFQSADPTGFGLLDTPQRPRPADGGAALCCPSRSVFRVDLTLTIARSVTRRREETLRAPPIIMRSTLRSLASIDVRLMSCMCSMCGIM